MYKIVVTTSVFPIIMIALKIVLEVFTTIELTFKHFGGCEMGLYIPFHNKF